MGKWNNARIGKRIGLVLLLVGLSIISPLKYAGAVANETPLAPLSVIDTTSLDEASLEAYFTQTKLPRDVRERITDVSYQKNNVITLDDLRYIRILYYGFDKKTHIGELIVNKKIATDTVHIFWELYQIRYEIEKVQLVDEYGADDTASMEDNNTSAFNYRMIEGTNRLSNHAKGLAIDLNPKYNPYVTRVGKKTKVSPINGKKYADRTLKSSHLIKKKDACYKIFAKYGFAWGGNWNYSKDYQHFDKIR